MAGAEPSPAPDSLTRVFIRSIGGGEGRRGGAGKATGARASLRRLLLQPSRWQQQQLLLLLRWRLLLLRWRLLLLLLLRRRRRRRLQTFKASGLMLGCARRARAHTHTHGRQAVSQEHSIPPGDFPDVAGARGGGRGGGFIRSITVAAGQLTAPPPFSGRGGRRQRGTGRPGNGPACAHGRLRPLFRGGIAIPGRNSFRGGIAIPGRNSYSGAE